LAKAKHTGHYQAESQYNLAPTIHLHADPPLALQDAADRQFSTSLTI
jgi:hypothetical protein